MDEFEQEADDDKYMAPMNFSLCHWMSCRRTANCTIKLFVFVGLVAAIGISFSLSPGYGAIDGFDLITSSSAAVYDFMIQSPENVHQIAGMILLPFYILIAAFVVVCIVRDDTWLMITVINGWIGALVICLTIGIPINEQRIRYWETGAFPLEYLLSDNTVNTHTVIAFICSHSIIDVLGANRIATTLLVSYNVLLAWFTIVVRCSSPQAVMTALLVGISAIYFNRAFNAKWVECQRDLATGRPVWGLGCLYRRATRGRVSFSDQETDPLRSRPEELASNGHVDTVIVQHRSFASLLKSLDKGTKAFEVENDDDEEESEDTEEKKETRRGDLDLPLKRQQREEMSEDTAIQSSSLCVATDPGEVELGSTNLEEEEIDELSDPGLEQ